MKTEVSNTFWKKLGIVHVVKTTAYKQTNK